MHLAEGTIPLSQALGWSAIAIPVLIWSIRGEQIERQKNPQSSVVIAAVTSVLFAATLLPLPVPVVGATSHICLTPLFALVVGVRRIVWPTFFVLLLQALFFAHGGLTTLGVNTLSLGLFGPLFTLSLWSLFRKIGVHNSVGLAFACGMGGLSVYVTDALVLGGALSDVADPVTTFFGVIVGFAPVQVPLSVLEGFVSMRIVSMLSDRRGDLLSESLATFRKSSISINAMLVLFIMMGLSGCTYEGIDGTVFGEAAEQAGNTPTDSIVDLSQGEMGLAMSILILFSCGFTAGSSWQRLFGGSDNAP